MPTSITLHDVLETLKKQALWTSRDVLISGQICGSNLQRVFTSGDGCCPQKALRWSFCQGSQIHVLFSEPKDCDPAGLVQITKTSESQKSEKNTKKNTKSPFPGWSPKIRKNYQKNTKMAQKSPFLYFFGNFFVFSGSNPGRGISYFFRNFFGFLGLRGFCNLYQARRVATQGT